jgi:hypothetical protein
MMIGLSSLFDGEDTARSTQRGSAPAAGQGVERKGDLPAKGVGLRAPTPDESDPKTRKGVEKVGIRPYEDSQTAQGRLVFDQTIPLQLWASSPERKDVADVRSIMFRKDKGQLLAVLRVRTASHPKCKWRVTVQLLDESGRELGSGVAVFENSGTVGGAPIEEEVAITLDFGADGDLSGATDFGVRIDPVAEDAAMMTHEPGD